MKKINNKPNKKLKKAHCASFFLKK